MAELGQQVALGSKTTLEATDEYNKFAGSLANVGQVAPKAGINIASLTTKIFAITAALTVATVAAKKLIDAVKSGAARNKRKVILP